MPIDPKRAKPAQQISAGIAGSSQPTIVRSRYAMAMGSTAKKNPHMTAVCARVLKTLQIAGRSFASIVPSRIRIAFYHPLESKADRRSGQHEPCAHPTAFVRAANHYG